MGLLQIYDKIASKRIGPLAGIALVLFALAILPLCFLSGLGLILVIMAFLMGSRELTFGYVVEFLAILLFMGWPLLVLVAAAKTGMNSKVKWAFLTGGLSLIGVILLACLLA